MIEDGYIKSITYHGRMKIRVVLDILGSLLILLGILMLIPGVVAAIYKEPAGVMALGLASLVTISAGQIIRHYGQKGDVMHKEAFVIVTLGWLLATFFGALPFIFSGLGVIDSLFETMSGFTTTGATVLTEYNSDGYWIINSTAVESSLAYRLMNSLLAPLTKYNLGFGYPQTTASISGTFYGLLFWRSFIQLLGGMGIILLFIAILPQLGVAGRQLYYVETSREPLTPRVKSTAKLFWGIYLGFVAVETLLLWAAGMPFYDSICTSFTTVSTAGYSPLASGIAAYDSLIIELIVVIFMIVGATSFLLHYQLIYKKNAYCYLKDPEFLFYMFLLFSATAIIVLWGGIEGDLLHRIRFAGFHVVSISTTTGFTNNFEYDHWSSAANMVLILLMLIGGCAGATAGGIKALRVLLVQKYTRRELVKLLHPKAVQSVRLGNLSITEGVLISVLFFTIVYLTIFFVSTIALLLIESKNFDTLSAMSAVATCMGGVGPGLGEVAFDFSRVTPLGKLVSFFCMYIGRMEIMPVLLWFLPDFWKR
ncbi:MAG: TrkH family potassium uptake protein [Methanothrix sp.]|nr:TrkH family potassium uptake protein [Methanothrix sp.]